MELSLITPVKHLDYTSLLPGRFCLAPIALKYTKYREYFSVASRNHGYEVILDNGIFEDDKVNDEDYIELVRQIKPKVLVIPDTINADAAKNWAAAIEFIGKLDAAQSQSGIPLDLELMYVVQCAKDDTEGFWAILEKAMQHKLIKWIGICRDAVYNAFSQYTHTEAQEINRFYFASRLQENYALNWYLRKKWHFLGIGKHFFLLPHFWFVDAMDTASLFYQSVLGNEMTSHGILPSSLKRPKDYFRCNYCNCAEWQLTLEYNCREALSWAQQADHLQRQILGGGRL